MTVAPQSPVPAAVACDPLAANNWPLDMAFSGDATADLPADKMALSELDRDDLFAMLESGDLFPELPVPDAKAGAQPFIGAGAGCSAPMIDFGEIHPEAPVVPAQVVSQPVRGESSSPTSSGTSYKPNSCSDSGSDFTESPKTEASSAKSALSLMPKIDKRIGRRKAEPDLSGITDIEERRKQRRLAKNRATAATSRARKRALMATLQQQVSELSDENSRLKDRLAACCCARGGGAPPGAAAARTRL